MHAKVFSAVLFGIEAKTAEIEVDLSLGGLSYFNIVGLPDKAIDESKDRINSALKNCGFNYPKKTGQKVVVNLAPANIKKEGSFYDLPIAISYLLASGQISFNPEKVLFAGELALNGDLKPVAGILPSVIFAKENNFSEFVVPYENFKEASLIDGVKIIPVKNILECIDYLEGRKEVKTFNLKEKRKNNFYPIDFSDIKGQEEAKRALMIAACGMHNILMEGPPGSGKTMLANALLSILPDMDKEEMIETLKIYSIAGKLDESTNFYQRPFRSPHHSSSYVSLVGGGKNVGPGEISLAHNGVLFLDELPEFHRDALEALRQPLEEGKITISRSSGSFTYPAKVMLVAAKNPCPCGYYNSNQKECICTPYNILRYNKKISGPILDRIDIHVNVGAVDYEKLKEKNTNKDESKKIKEIILKAQERQKERFKTEKIKSNSEMTTRLIEKYCVLDEKAKSILDNVVKRFKLSGRSYFKLIKLSQTIADIEGSDCILENHLLEALHYRTQKEF